ncbi:MAG: hypothetical protein ACYDD4_04430 [Acidimicrobiales bacterium]
MAGTSPRRLVAPWAIAVVFYGAVSCLLWRHMLVAGMGESLVTHSADPTQNVWWLAWIPHALGSAADPFFTRGMYYPSGVNVVSNTSFPLLGLLLSPLTVAAGPLVSFNIAMVAVPVCDALACFGVVGRWVRWTPARLAAGLLYGLGPFVRSDLYYGHLNLTVLLVPPLVLGVMDRILVRQDGSPWRQGAALGTLLAAEFLVSTEMLALLVIVVVVGVVVVAVGWWRPAHVAHAARALACAAAVGGGLLAWPLWWFVAGPRHFTGAVWADMPQFAASLSGIVTAHGELPGVQFVSGANGGYLGVTLLAAVVVCLLWRRAPAIMRWAAVMVVMCEILALGSTLHIRNGDTHVPLPGWPLFHLPLLSSAVTSRFAAFSDLAAALMVAVGMEALRRITARLSSAASSRARALSSATAIVAAVVVLGPDMAIGPWTYVVEREPVPAVVTELSALVGGGAVRGGPIREYPPVSGANATEMLWQAVTGLHYDIVDGYAIVPGRHGRASEVPAADVVDELFAALDLGRLRAPFAPSTVAALRRGAWEHGAGAIVVVAGARGSAQALVLLRAALGPPEHQERGGAIWVARAP